MSENSVELPQAGPVLGTSCRFCEFNVKNADGIQTGCELSLLDRYDVPMTLKPFEDERGKGEAYEIGTFCIFRRPPGWKDAKKELLTDGKTYENIAREEMKIPVTLVVIIKPTDSFEDVVSFLKHHEEMVDQPKKVLLLNFARISPLTFLRLNDLTKLEWSMEFMLNNSEQLDQLRKNGFDLASKKVRTSYFVTLDVKDRLALDYISNVEKSIVDDLQRFVAIVDNIDKPNFYQTIVYRHVRGYEQADVNDKIRWLAEDQQCPHLVKTPEEVFQK